MIFFSGVMTEMSQLESNLQEGTHTSIHLLFPRVDHSSRRPVHDVRVRATLYLPHDSAHNLPGGIPGEIWDRRIKLHCSGYWHHRDIADLGRCNGQGVRKTEAEAWDWETRVPFV